ncbi:hypothetical protein KC19_5G195400 [Ceratodon purpureus]|uniref:Uncharacterized protein n=2 Tax=Ceratodon purpureus TaxID=3225 RepID=A0A8T0I5J9_CERPU|nr:hypothetical protein KC19_5G195400 [Ceratodon purpureus]KAG0577970.1 hypothetical protein KC19_5G195400 [Ceratodon purpureus]KAG0577971.1 hypothetical protein KC19_5G195400 [Ceratodon purpureus]
MNHHSMALAATSPPGAVRLPRCVSRSGNQVAPGPVRCAALPIELKQKRRVTGYLQHCPLFAKHVHSNVGVLRGKYGRLVTTSGAADIFPNRGSSSPLQSRAEKLADAVCITACPRGTSQFMISEILRQRHVIHTREIPERRASVRTNAGRNKKWRNLEKGRLEGNKRTRSNGNANPGKPRPPTPGPDNRDGAVQGPEDGVNQDGTERAERVPRVKPKKGPKPRERVTWAGQDMLLLNSGERFKIGKEVTPWASVRTERMPDDYYKYGPFGPHAWKGVAVGTPRRATLADNMVVFFGTVENEEEHEQGDIQDCITGYSKRLDQMDESVGIQYYFAFVRQVQKVPNQSPWEEWTLVAQVAIESGDELDKWTLGEKLDRIMFEHITRCVAWFRPDLIYVKKPAYQIRFEPQKEFIEGWLKLLNPDNEPVNSRADSYYRRLCSLLGVAEDEEAEKVGTIFDGFSEDKKMECIEHVLTNHPVWLLYPYTHQTMQAEKQQESVVGMNTSANDIESIEADDDEDEDAWSEDDTRDDDSDEEFDESELGAFNGQYGEDFEFDEQDDGRSVGNEWEREEAKALAAEAMLDSPNAEIIDVDEEYWNEQAVKAYADIGIKSTKGKEIVEETETQQEELFLDAAVRPFTYTNLIKEVFIVRKALVDYAALRSWSR